MESIVICSVANVLDPSIGQQDVVLALSNSVGLLVLRVSKVITRVEVPHSVSKCVAGFLLIMVLLVSRAIMRIRMNMVGEG